MDDFHKCKQIYELTELHNSPASVRTY
jgi:hypothetical protein